MPKVDLMPNVIVTTYTNKYQLSLTNQRDALHIGMILRLAFFSVEYRLVTDRHDDGIYRASMASEGENRRYNE